jgi:hypothetical protein
MERYDGCEERVVTFWLRSGHFLVNKKRVACELYEGHADLAGRFWSGKETDSTQRAPMKLFQSFRLDTLNHSLWRVGACVPLAPKAIDLLRQWTPGEYPLRQGIFTDMLLIRIQPIRPDRSTRLTGHFRQSRRVSKVRRDEPVTCRSSFRSLNRAYSRKQFGVRRLVAAFR